MIKTISALALACGMASAQPAQAPNPTQSENSARMAGGETPIYRVTVVARTMKAINYHHRSGSTHIGFRGTALMPMAKGEAKVESKQGVIKIDAELEKLEPATSFGPEYLTYVMWAITPEGRATNVGEVLLNGGRSKLNATSELQSFGLIITAEPYFAVTQPSDVVVMENFVRTDTTGTIEEVDAKFELLQRGQYTLNVNPSEIHPFKLDPKVPLELYEARNAVQIARWTGAKRYAAETYRKAEIGLLNAEGYLQGKSGKKPIGTVAREAVQMAEDARIITVKKIGEELLANERQAGTDREARAATATASAKAETDRVSQDAERAALESRRNSARMKRESDGKLAAAQSEADRMKRDNEAQAAATLAAQSDAERTKRESEAKIAAAQSESDRMKRESDSQTAAALAAQADAERMKRDSDAKLASAQTEADRMKREGEAKLASAQTEADRMKREGEAKLASAQTEADRMKLENESQRAAAKADQDRFAADKAQAETEKGKLRAQLLLQFNAILQTRDTARGLIVNMSDVLFDTAKFSLRPAAREKLARVAGILQSHPGLRLEVEGFTDSVGAEAYNQQLSEERAGSVRDYLTKSGIPTAAVTAKGFGETLPVASNETAAGRQQNRRVELVVSGSIIGGGIRLTPIASLR